MISQRQTTMSRRLSVPAASYLARPQLSLGFCTIVAGFGRCRVQLTFHCLSTPWDASSRTWRSNILSYQSWLFGISKLSRECVVVLFPFFPFVLRNVIIQCCATRIRVHWAVLVPTTVFGFLHSDFYLHKLFYLECVLLLKLYQCTSLKVR